MSSPFDTLEQKLGYRFKQQELCQTALTHKSWVNENRVPDRTDNERLEFLGDAVLALVVSDLLMKKHPQRPEGELSKVRAAVVNEAALAAVAERLDLGQWIYLGRGEEQAGGRRKRSILSDTLEALVGGVFRDGGFDSAYHVVEGLVGRRLDEADADAESDYKSRLQEWSQGHLKVAPTYEVVGQQGPEHDKVFEVVLRIGTREYARATGRSKKAAQQAAAALALDVLEAEATAGEGPGKSDGRARRP